jgi:hypothetical protein
MARCGPIPFFGLLIMTVVGVELIIGGTWVTATLAGLFACSLSMVGFTAWRLCKDGWLEARVFVNNEMMNEVEVTAATVQGVVAGENVVIGMPVDGIIENNTVVMREVFLGRALVGYDHHLRAAGVA